MTEAPRRPGSASSTPVVGEAPIEPLSEILGPLLAALVSEQDAWQRLIARLPPEDLNRPVDGPWSTLDALIHITSWVENAVRVARQQRETDAPDPGPTRGPAGVLHIDVDRFNEAVVSAHRGWTREQVLAWNRRVSAELSAALAQLPIARVVNGRGRHGARMWFWLPGVIHSSGHRRRIERLLAAP